MPFHDDPAFPALGLLGRLGEAFFFQFQQPIHPFPDHGRVHLRLHLFPRGTGAVRVREGMEIHVSNLADTGQGVFKSPTSLTRKAGDDIGGKAYSWRRPPDLFHRGAVMLQTIGPSHGFEDAFIPALEGQVQVRAKGTVRFPKLQEAVLKIPPSAGGTSYALDTDNDSE